MGRAASGLKGLCLLAAAMFALTSCGESASGTSMATSAAAPKPDETLDCSERVEPPPVGGTEGLGYTRIVLKDDAGLGISLMPPPSQRRAGGKRLYVWKMPLALTASKRVFVQIDRRDKHLARFEFLERGAFQKLPRTLRIESCSADEPRFSGEGTVGPETGWAGALVATRPALCLRVRVIDLADNSLRRVVLPLGGDCA